MIRLQRLGKSKHPSYRVIVSDKRRDPHAESVEVLGFYQPAMRPKAVRINKERVAYWLGVGAQPSATMQNLLISLGVMKDKKRRSVFLSEKRKAALAKKNAEPAASV